MKHAHWILPLLVTTAMTVASAAQPSQEKGGTDDFGPYVPEANWLKPLRPGYLERGCSVFVESPNRIWYTTDLEFPVPATGRRPGGGASLARGGMPPGATHAPKIMILDANGNVVEEWTQWEHLLSMPHRVAISPYDPERSVWIIDRDYDQVFKFSHDGKKLLLTLGEQGVPGSDEKHFGRPTDIALSSRRLVLYLGRIYQYPRREV